MEEKKREHHLVILTIEKMRMNGGYHVVAVFNRRKDALIHRTKLYQEMSEFQKTNGVKYDVIGIYE